MVFMENFIKRKNDIRMAMAQNRVEVRKIGVKADNKGNPMVAAFLKGFRNYSRRFR